MSFLAPLRFPSSFFFHQRSHIRAHEHTEFNITHSSRPNVNVYISATKEREKERRNREKEGEKKRERDSSTYKVGRVGVGSTCRCAAMKKTRPQESTGTTKTKGAYRKISRLLRALPRRNRPPPPPPPLSLQ